MTDSFHRDNHYLPQIYLEPWEDSNRQVRTYRLLVAHEKVPLWKLRSKKAVAWHSHLYAQIVTGHETAVLRPRIVNPEEVQRERDQWSSWNEQQVLAEQEMDETRDS